MFKKILKWLGICVLGIIASLSDCAGKDVKSLSDKELVEKVKSISENINLLITDKTCDSTSQCGSIKYGHKPCGGPMEYKIFSSKSTDVDKIEYLSRYFFELTKEYNERYFVFSYCIFINQPKLICDVTCR